MPGDNSHFDSTTVALREDMRSDRLKKIREEKGRKRRPARGQDDNPIPVDGQRLSGKDISGKDPSLQTWLAVRIDTRHREQIARTRKNLAPQPSLELFHREHENKETLENIKSIPSFEPA